MQWWDRGTMAFRTLFGRGSAGAHLNDELSFHLERQIAENVAAGMNAEEARHAALRSFGNPTLLREQARATWSWGWLESLAHDLRYSVRALLRTPGFSWMAIAVMALGIGANIALFTVVRGVLLKPLPYQDPQQLFTLYEADSHHKGGHKFLPTDFGSFSVWQSAVRDRAQIGGCVAMAGLQRFRRGRPVAGEDRCGMVHVEFLQCRWCAAGSRTQLY